MPEIRAGDSWIPSTRFLPGIRAICDKNDWLMISDEVLTGPYRRARETPWKYRNRNHA